MTTRGDNSKLTFFNKNIASKTITFINLLKFGDSEALIRNYYTRNTQKK